VRVTDRPVYAEVGPVQADGDGVRVSGRLIGASPQGALVEARLGDQKRELPVTCEGAVFRVTVAALPAGTWSLWLRPGADRDAVPLAGLRDDVVDKRVAYVLPAARIDGVTLQPAYLDDNTFAVRATA
jgi:hypothetical protein